MLAGLGAWGGTWVQVIRDSPHWELVALVDSDTTVLDSVASMAGIPTECSFTSIAEAAAAVETDAALVAVPPAVHAPLASAALDVGLHCLIEKPFASTLEDAHRIVDRAEAVGRVVMVSQQYRYRPGARTVQRLVAEGAIGRIGAVYVSFLQTLLEPGFRLEMEEPLLWDMAIHHFDLIRGILELEPVRVLATSFNPSWSEYAGNAAATALLETEDGAVVTYTGSWVPRGRVTGWDGVWEIVGENGSILWDGDVVLLRPLGESTPLGAKVLRRVAGQEWNGRKVTLEPIRDADRGGSLAELSSAIREQREPETSGRDNIRSLALVVGAVESARRRAAVDVREL